MVMLYTSFTKVWQLTMSTTMTERTELVGIRLTPEEHEKFTEYIEDSNEFDSMSRFFRTIAHRYVATEDEEPSLDPEEIIEAVDAAVTPLSERLEQMEEHIVSIDSNVRDDDKIDRLARDIYSSLPTHSDETGLPELDDIGKYRDASDLAIVQGISTAYMWARYFDEDLQDVRRACARMQEYYPDANFIRDDINNTDTHIQSHDDLGQTSSSTTNHAPHTDIRAGSDDGSTSRSVDISNRDDGTVRRFYKTGGD